jgi:hypothetical protein
MKIPSLAMACTESWLLALPSLHSSGRLLPLSRSLTLWPLAGWNQDTFNAGQGTEAPSTSFATSTCEQSQACPWGGGIIPLGSVKAPEKDFM